MKDNDVAQISEQFGLTKEIVEASVTDGTLGTRIKDSLSKKVIYDPDKFEAFKKNHAAEVVNSYYNDLVEKAKKGDVPQDLYVPIKGATLQQKEREWSKKFNVETYKDIDDLIEQVVKTSANGKTKPEIEQQINELKNANLKLKEEKENAVKLVQDEYKGKFLNNEMSITLDQIPFDFTDAKADEIATKKQKVQTILKSVFNQEYKLDTDSQGRTIVLKGSDVLKNNATLEPLPVKDVLISLAKEFNLKLTSPDIGGQGGTGSRNSSDAKLSPEEFRAYCTANNIPNGSAESMKIWKERGAH